MEEREKKQELLKLLNVPAVTHFFINQLEDIKTRFASEIDSYNKMLEDENKGDDTVEELFEEDNTYQFELHLDNQSSSVTTPQWRLVKFKYDRKKEIVNKLFSQLEKRLANHQAVGGVIKQENILLKSHFIDRAFEVSFMRSREDRVVGYVKRIETENSPERPQPSMLKIPTNYQTFATQENEMYSELKQWMKEDPDIRDEIFFYFFILKSQRKSS